VTPFSAPVVHLRGAGTMNPAFTDVCPSATLTVGKRLSFTLAVDDVAQSGFSGPVEPPPRRRIILQGLRGGGVVGRPLGASISSQRPIYCLHLPPPLGRLTTYCYRLTCLADFLGLTQGPPRTPAPSRGACRRTISSGPPGSFRFEQGTVSSREPRRQGRCASFLLVMERFRRNFVLGHHAGR